MILYVLNFINFQNNLNKSKVKGYNILEIIFRILINLMNFQKNNKIKIKIILINLNNQNKVFLIVIKNF